MIVCDGGGECDGGDCCDVDSRDGGSGVLARCMIVAGVFRE